MDNPLHDIHHFSPKLNIQQLLKFCERRNMGVTRAMVQNFIRDGLLPPPAGRQYTHKHLAALAVIQKLKTVFDMASIKEALLPHMDDEGLPLDTYARMMSILEQAHSQWEAHVAPVFVEAGVGRLSRMAHAAALKGMIANGVDT